MGVYYTKKCTTLFEKVGLSRKYMAIEVCPQDQEIVFLNTNTRVALDDITKMTWEANLKLKMILSPQDKVCVKFEEPNDLRAFLGDLNLDIPVEWDTDGGICPGRYAARGSVRSSERASDLLGSIMDTMRSKRRNSKSYSFDRSSRGSLAAGSAATF
ncbi:hypothetical protein DYB28_013320 [Aphanomyces astaci]|uniref:Uncharacterized protein n=1 Tax=Aphanomyces astaci TaxID=112090 RepID=A0A397B8A0_APHAT|nr:hypothetical protein DYB25_012126 [Aphanomyces astaci]RHY15499.1 hypothetical protein DYB36_006058 [Aphanomyces astaci]RHY51839.1 hypothetical protein DYB38_005628 [Aphanomyces astaci]RHY59268.1 hypothetical protein DYB34_005316 [Aphanomyces astaci]RHY61907.1 hypothetical protein DYB30_004728 [Aphanomyces astaci]